MPDTPGRYGPVPRPTANTSCPRTHRNQSGFYQMEPDGTIKRLRRRAPEVTLSQRRFGFKRRHVRSPWLDSGRIVGYSEPIAKWQTSRG